MPNIGDSDLDVFPLNLGGNVFGWTADRDESFDILDAFVAGGGNFIDTADSYSTWAPGNSGGESEAIIGEWLARRGSRDGLVIATKVSRHPEYMGLSPANIGAAVDASLHRLGVEYIDLYYAHYDDPVVPVADYVGALSSLVDAGKVRHLGISNFTAARIDEWFAATEADGLHRAIALQSQYSLVERGFETNGLREAAQRHGLGVLSWEALALGFLTGKYRAGADVDSPRAGGASRYLNERGIRVLSVLDDVAARRATSPATIALAWVRQQATVVAPVASARATDQLPDLLASASFEITADEIAALS